MSLNTNFLIQFFNWWKISIGGTSSYRKYQVIHTPKQAEKAYFFHNYYLNQTFSLPKNIEIELTAWHNSTIFDGPNKIDGFGVMNFGIAKKLNKNKGTFQFAISDIFKSMNIYTQLGVVTPVVFIEQSRVKYTDETAYSRIFKLSYSRSFGNKLNKHVRASGADEEKERIRQ
jgi:iron complex outermembrane recepter protein